MVDLLGVGDAAAGHVVLGGWVLIGSVGVVEGKAGGGAYRRGVL